MPGHMALNVNKGPPGDPEQTSSCIVTSLAAMKERSCGVAAIKKLVNRGWFCSEMRIIGIQIHSESGKKRATRSDAVLRPEHE
jgi:hypothetical protein